MVHLIFNKLNSGIQVPLWLEEKTTFQNIKFLTDKGYLMSK